MKPTILILSLLMSFLAIFAQGSGFKYSKKTNIVYENNKPLFKIENDKEYKSQVLVKNLNDSLLVFFIPKEMQTVIPSTKKNPNGSVYCKVCVLLTPKRNYVEVKDGENLKYYVKMVYDNKLILDNKLDTVAINVFIKKVGNSYSSKYLIYDENTKTISTPYRN